MHAPLSRCSSVPTASLSHAPHRRPSLPCNIVLYCNSVDYDALPSIPPPESGCSHEVLALIHKNVLNLTLDGFLRWVRLLELKSLHMLSCTLSHAEPHCTAQENCEKHKADPHWDAVECKKAMFLFLSHFRPCAHLKRFIISLDFFSSHANISQENDQIIQLKRSCDYLRECIKDLKSHIVHDSFSKFLFEIMLQSIHEFVSFSKPLVNKISHTQP